MFKNVASQKVIFFAFDATTNVPKTGDAANITPYVSKDFGAVTAMTDTSATEMDATNAPGYYLVDISQTESNADVLLLSAKSSTANIKVIGSPATIFTYPSAFGLAGGASGGFLISGSNAGTTTLGALTVTGATTHTGNVVLSDGFTISAPSTSNRAGITVTGNGTGAGISVTSGNGSTGNGVDIIANATNSYGLKIIGKGNQSGLNVQGGATGNGADLWGGATSGTGVFVSTVDGTGISVAAAGASKHGININGGTSGTCDGINSSAGTGGVAIRATAITGTLSTVTTATTATNLTNAPTNGDLTATMKTSVTTAATAATPTISTLGANTITATACANDFLTAAKIANGAIDLATFAADVGNLSMRSSTATAGGATSITLDAGASASDDFYNNTLIMLTGGTGVGQSRFISDYVGSTKVATVATWITNPDNTTTFSILPYDAVAGASAPTAAQVATAVWQDSTSGDFTAASSIGKALYVSNVAPGGSGGHMISGSNSGTTTLGALTVTGVTTHTGNVVLSDGLTVSAPSTSNRAGVTVTGNGTGAGISVTGGNGATGNGVTVTANSTNGNGIATTGTGTGDGLIATGGASAGGDGLSAVAGGGVDIRGNQTGNLVGTVSTLTTYTGNTVQTGDAYARLGAPAGASVSADVAAIQAKTTNLPAAPASTTNITAGTITTVTNLTNAPTAGDFTATMKTSIGTAVAASAVASVTAPVTIAASQLLIKKNTQLVGFPFKMVLTSDHVSSATGKTITATRSIDGGAFSACANSATEISSGWYKITLADTDLNGSLVALKFTATACDQRDILVVTQA